MIFWSLKQTICCAESGAASFGLRSGLHHMVSERAFGDMFTPLWKLSVRCSNWNNFIMILLGRVVSSLLRWVSVSFPSCAIELSVRSLVYTCRFVVPSFRCSLNLDRVKRFRRAWIHQFLQWLWVLLGRRQESVRLGTMMDRSCDFLSCAFPSSSCWLRSPT